MNTCVCGVNNNAICFTYTSCYHNPNISGPLNQRIAWCFPLEPTLLLLLLPYPQQNLIWWYQLHIACSMKLIGSAWPPSRRFIRLPLNSFPFFFSIFSWSGVSGRSILRLPSLWTSAAVRSSSERGEYYRKRCFTAARNNCKLRSAEKTRSKYNPKALNFAADGNSVQKQQQKEQQLQQQGRIQNGGSGVGGGSVGSGPTGSALLGGKKLFKKF